MPWLYLAVPRCPPHGWACVPPVDGHLSPMDVSGHFAESHPSSTARMGCACRCCVDCRVILLRPAVALTRSAPPLPPPVGRLSAMGQSLQFRAIRSGAIGQGMEVGGYRSGAICQGLEVGGCRSKAVGQGPWVAPQSRSASTVVSSATPRPLGSRLVSAAVECCHRTIARLLASSPSGCLGGRQVNASEAKA